MNNNTVQRYVHMIQNREARRCHYSRLETEIRERLRRARWERTMRIEYLPVSEPEWFWFWWVKLRHKKMCNQWEESFVKGLYFLFDCLSICCSSLILESPCLEWNNLLLLLHLTNNGSSQHWIQTHVKNLQFLGRLRLLGIQACVFNSDRHG